MMPSEDCEEVDFLGKQANEVLFSNISRRDILLSNRCDIGALRRLFSGYSCILLCHNKSMTYENLWRGISHTHCQFAMKPFRTVAVLRALNVLLRNGLQVARLEKIAATRKAVVTLL